MATEYTPIIINYNERDFEYAEWNEIRVLHPNTTVTITGYQSYSSLGNYRYNVSRYFRINLSKPLYYAQNITVSGQAAYFNFSTTTATTNTYTWTYTGTSGRDVPTRNAYIGTVVFTKPVYTLTFNQSVYDGNSTSRNFYVRNVRAVM